MAGVVPTHLSMELWAGVFARLPALEILRCSAVAKFWRLAGCQPRAWETARLMLGSTDIDPANCLENWLDAALLPLACRLRDVAVSAGLAVLPQRLRGRHQRGSKLEVCRYHFGPVSCWLLQYNVRNFGLLHDLDEAMGLKVWPSCVFFCRFICCDARAPRVAGKRCLELGAGAGLLSVVLAGLGADLLATEQEAACLRVLPVNIKLNGLAQRCCVSALSFGATSILDFAAQHGQFELLFGSDIVYSEELSVPLFETVTRLLSADGRFFLVHATREEPVTAELIRAAQSAGLIWDLLKLPVSSREAHLTSEPVLFQFRWQEVVQLDTMD